MARIVRTMGSAILLLAGSVTGLQQPHGLLRILRPRRSIDHPDQVSPPAFKDLTGPLPIADYLDTIIAGSRSRIRLRRERRATWRFASKAA